MTFIPPTQETSVTDSVRGQLGVEFPYALGKQVEELMADLWEEMRKAGWVLWELHVVQSKRRKVSISLVGYELRFEYRIARKFEALIFRGMGSKSISLHNVRGLTAYRKPHF